MNHPEVNVAFCTLFDTLKEVNTDLNEVGNILDPSPLDRRLIMQKGVNLAETKLKETQVVTRLVLHVFKSEDKKQPLVPPFVSSGQESADNQNVGETCSDLPEKTQVGTELDLHVSKPEDKNQPLVPPFVWSGEESADNQNVGETCSDLPEKTQVGTELDLHVSKPEDKEQPLVPPFVSSGQESVDNQNVGETSNDLPAGEPSEASRSNQDDDVKMAQIQAHQFELILEQCPAKLDVVFVLHPQHSRVDALGEDLLRVMRYFNRIILNTHEDAPRILKATLEEVEKVRTNKKLIVENLYNIYVSVTGVGLRAMPDHKEALKHEPTSLACAIVLNSLMVLLVQNGMLEEGLILGKRALDLKKGLRGKFHLDVAKQLNNLAVLYYKQENYEEAIKCLKEVRLIYGRLLEPDSEHILKTNYELSCCYEHQKLRNKAVNL